MFLLSKLARDSGFKVVLTGEGADEVLAGYDIFKEAAIRRFCARRPESTLRPALLHRLYTDVGGLAGASTPFLAAFFRAGAGDPDSPFYSHLVRWRNNARTRRFFAERIVRDEDPGPELPPGFTGWGPLARGQFLESTVFLSQYLLSSQGDRMAMAHSVETRLPFLDYRVIEFANRLPPSFKLRGLTEKYLLRRLGRKLLPADVWARPKRPYRAPIHRSFFSPPVPDYVGELLSAERIRAAGLFDPAAVERLAARAARGQPLSETDDMALAGILSTQLVHHLFISHFSVPKLVTGPCDNIPVCGPHRRSRIPPAQPGLEETLCRSSE
jgi:asparagine synthase (glutamine-hydrolysing)